MNLGITRRNLPPTCRSAWRLVLFIATFTLAGVIAHADVNGWLAWRGPTQNGVSPETGLPDTWEPGGENHLWTYNLSGRGTALTAGDRVYAWGYDGEESNLQEVLVCLDLETGERIWERRFNDFISDTIYNRYSIGAPAIDPQTGNIYLLTTAGELVGMTADGDELWRHSLMETIGRLTFPNGRTGAPVIDGDRVIVHGITSNWGADGPGRDRFYAYDKMTGDLIWASTPGVGPQDSSYSTPVLNWRNGQRVLYCGTGCGNVVCVNAVTGQPLWRYQLSRGGVNASVLLDGDRLFAIHGMENLDTSEKGRMIGLNLPEQLPRFGEAQQTLSADSELWRLPLSHFTSSPVLANDRIYQVTSTGDLYSVNADTGEILWTYKLDNEQLHASPLFADGKLYISMITGLFYIIRPDDSGPEVLTRVELEGNGIGSPSAWNGKVLVHTTEKLYCFGSAGDNPNGTFAWPKSEQAPQPSEPVALQPMPSEVLMIPGDSQNVRVRAFDALGQITGPVDDAEWAEFIPPSARVRSTLDASFESGKLTAPENAKLSAGAFQATGNGLAGTLRGRILPDPPYDESFDAFELTETDPNGGANFAYPPLPWIGARFKWDVRDLDGNNVLAKTLDRLLFQRAMTFLGHPRLSNYTVTADVRSEGNRRVMGVVGVVNQRYIIALDGNWQQLEVSSNHERLKVSTPFTWRPDTWYRLKTRVDLANDGSGVVRAKAWPRSETEPADWTIEVPHERAHTHGSPGLFGFSPQNQVRVYVDNISVQSNR